MSVPPYLNSTSTERQRGLRTLRRLVWLQTALLLGQAVVIVVLLMERS